MDVNESTYDRIRKERCEWCRKGYELDEVYGHPDLPCHMTGDGDFPCTAPSPEAVIEEHAATIARLTARVAPKNMRDGGAYRPAPSNYLADCEACGDTVTSLHVFCPYCGAGIQWT